MSTKPGFKVEFRKTCKVCGAPITKKRFRTFCSKECRDKFVSPKIKQYRAEYQRNRMQKKAEIPSKDKLKCAICGRWYVQVGTHVRMVHHMTAKEYRIQFDLPIKKGISTTEFRKMKEDHARENGTINNLKKGKINWYSKGDVRAKINTGWKGRNGSKGYVPNEYYN